tara:strand:- start:80 stop:499 length:420 start_codon:yes stop_codon:yes gene_type:complete
MDSFSELITHYWWLALLIVAFPLFVFAKKLGKDFGGEVVEIKVDQVVELLEQQALLIDLAEKRTYEKGYIAGSVNMPGITFIDGTATIDAVSKPIILIPMKGLIPMPVVQYLQSVGANKIYVFRGGIKEWQAAGFSIEN